MSFALSHLQELALPSACKANKGERVLAEQSHIKFQDRDEAVNKLLEVMSLRHLNLEESVFIATSFDGLYFANSLAQKLKVRLDYLFTKTIFAPLNPECQIAIVSEELDIVINEELIHSFGISLDYVYGEAKRQYEEGIIPKRYKYRKGEPLSLLKNKDVFLIDQGIETGLTALCGIKTCVNLHARSVRIAVPILPTSLRMILNQVCDEVLYVEMIENFVSVGHYYKQLEPIPTKQVEQILDQCLQTNTKDIN